MLFHGLNNNGGISSNTVNIRNEKYANEEKSIDEVR